MDTVDRMESDGYLKAGYNYIGIDDCWMERKRDIVGNLVPDKTRFPRGMKFIGDYVSIQKSNSKTTEYLFKKCFIFIYIDSQ